MQLLLPRSTRRPHLRASSIPTGFRPRSRARAHMKPPNIKRIIFVFRLFYLRASLPGARTHGAAALAASPYSCAQHCGVSRENCVRFSVIGDKKRRKCAAVLQSRRGLPPLCGQPIQQSSNKQLSEQARFLRAAPANGGRAWRTTRAVRGPNEESDLTQLLLYGENGPGRRRLQVFVFGGTRSDPRFRRVNSASKCTCK